VSEQGAHHIVPVRTYLVIYAVLMGLLVATVAGSYLPLGSLHLTVALVIAGIKAALIVMYFMHVKFSNRLTWVFSTAAFFWLIILLAFSLADYFSRGWLDVAGK
jgi:cytochrome c oxidase subunit 4